MFVFFLTLSLSFLPLAVCASMFLNIFHEGLKGTAACKCIYTTFILVNLKSLTFKTWKLQASLHHLHIQIILLIIFYLLSSLVIKASSSLSFLPHDKGYSWYKLYTKLTRLILSCITLPWYLVT